ncbi:adenosine receptor A3 isoform X2 [Nematostella vectensis]|uniref:adenosine receptor A3 isoform X2 n=1 Tax=Nematostella vectensis TaxID=45351 RepID=UPI0020772872|nr:adenosine receptor A3 isoform X2 [Nematostella vectensis]
MNITPSVPVSSLHEEFATRPPWVTGLESTVYIPIVLTAFIGNSIVLWILIRNRRLRTIPNLFVMSLALSDVLLPVLSSAPSVVIITQGAQVISDTYCQFQGFTCTWLACVSLATLTFMAVNRYYRIVKPDRYRTVFTAKRTKLLLSAIWGFSLLSPSFPLLDGKKFTFHPGKFFCYVRLEPVSVFFLILFLGIPLVTITTCYFKVHKALRHHNACMRNPNSESAQISVFEIRVTKTLFATVAAFWVCWIPIAIVDFTEMAIGEWSLPRRVYYMYSIFGISSSSANPIIYGVMNKSFNDEYRKLFRCYRKSSRRESVVFPTQPEVNRPTLVSVNNIELRSV